VYSVSSFNDLGLAEPLLKALAAEGYTQPTPIQGRAIPPLLEGRDLLGIAQTGTGKTAAFALPILHHLAQHPKQVQKGQFRALILSPTRELASQIGESFRAYGKNMKLKQAVIFGGVGYGPQISALAGGLDILIATPGRLIDHLEQNKARLDGVEFFVLDEADQMLDLGFVKPIQRIVAKLPAKRQNLLFSATMPGEIGKLAQGLLKNPVTVSVTPASTTAERVDQRVLLVQSQGKRALLSELFTDPALKRTLVFTRTKRGADKVARHLEANGVPAAAIHGNKSQNQREKALIAFKAGRIRALVATDIAARGIDVDGVTHVVNFELPNVAESYVHRIGRTARAGAAGIAIAFCDDEERPLLRDIEKLIKRELPKIDRRRDQRLAQAA